MIYDFAAVKARIDLAALFREDGHELKRMGAKQRCLSPFQREKTPSCYVDSDRQRFKCFSSGACGDIFDYVMQSRGCDLEAAYSLLADKAGITASQVRFNVLPLPILTRPEVVEEKPLSPLCGEDLEVWEEGCRYLASHSGECVRIAAWRGFSSRTVLELASEYRIGLPVMNRYLRSQDAEPGERRVAFPVVASLGEERALELVASHTRLKARAGERKSSWRFWPFGCGAWPYVLGDVRAASFLIVCEGQWDAMAFFDALGLSYAELLAERVAIAAMRGAANWQLFVEHYLLAHGTHRRDLRVMVVCDSDLAGETWSTPGPNDEPCLVQVLQEICGKVHVREPVESLGKDVNDVWKVINAGRVVE